MEKQPQRSKYASSSGLSSSFPIKFTFLCKCRLVLTNMCKQSTLKNAIHTVAGTDCVVNYSKKANKMPREREQQLESALPKCQILSGLFN